MTKNEIDGMKMLNQRIKEKGGIVVMSDKGKTLEVMSADKYLAIGVKVITELG